MKKLFFIFLISFFCFIFLTSQEGSSYEKYINIDGKLYKVIISENGDTLSKTEIEVEKNVKDAENPKSETVKEYNPQLLRIVPYKWQAGWYGAWQGFSYGFFITEGLGLSTSRIAPLVYLSTPSLMFFLPPLLIKDDVPIRSLAFIDWGYRLGPFDFIVLRNSFGKSPFGNLEFGPFNLDFLGLSLTGYTQSWLGYYLSRKNENLRRAASDFYASGAVLGYVSGGLIGLYLAEKLVPENPDQSNIDWNDSTQIAQYNDSIFKLDNKRELYGFTTAFLSSTLLRSLGFYLGNREDLKFKSFDGYFYTFNMLPGILLTIEVYNYIDRKDEFPLVAGISGLLSTVVTSYFMRNIRLDDGNAILMMIGGIVGGALGQGIERTIAAYTDDDNIHSSIGAFSMILGEYLVYLLRRNAIQSGIDFGSNIGFYIYPSTNKGIGGNLTFNF
ncbi:MAG: hypothetical protein ABIN00_04720 [candidate division WOR-3 bacterium]